MMKTTFRIEEHNGAYNVLDNGSIIAQGFPSREMALHGLWAYMGKVITSRYTCEEDGNVLVEMEDILR